MSCISHQQKLGPLEKEIMDIVWDSCPCSVRDVCNRLQEHRPVAYTTVMTVMGRLVEKGILCKDERNKAHVYNVCTSRKDMAQMQAHTLISSIFDDYGDDGLVALQEEFSQLTEDQKKKLRTLLEK